MLSYHLNINLVPEQVLDFAAEESGTWTNWWPSNQQNELRSVNRNLGEDFSTRNQLNAAAAAAASKPQKMKIRRR